MCLVIYCHYINVIYKLIYLRILGRKLPDGLIANRFQSINFKNKSGHLWLQEKYLQDGD